VIEIAAAIGAAILVLLLFWILWLLVEKLLDL
jgi:hypothetical protein